MTTEATTNRTESHSKERPFYSKVVLGGLAGFAIATVILGVGIAMEKVEDAAFAVIILAVVGTVAGVVARFGGKAHILSAIAGLAGLALLGPFIFIGLESPDSFFEFSAMLIGVVSLLTVIGASIAAIVQSRRPSPRTQGTGFELAAIRVAIPVLVVAVAVSGVLTVTGIDRVSATEKQGAVTVKMKASAFETETINVKAGTPAKLVVVNSDPFTHTFTVKDLDIDVRFGPKDEKLVVINTDRPGTYAFICDVPGHSQMKGTIVVQ